MSKTKNLSTGSIDSQFTIGDKQALIFLLKKRDVQVLQIEQFITQHPEILKITHLDISDTHIGGEGAKTLAKVLQHTHITSLNIRYSYIGGEGAKALAEVLQHTHITSLNIRDNYIGGEGAEALAEVLQDTNITSLNIGYNNIRDKGAEALADAVKANRESANKNFQELQKLIKAESFEISDKTKYIFLKYQNCDKTILIGFNEELQLKTDRFVKQHFIDAVAEEVNMLPEIQEIISEYSGKVTSILFGSLPSDTEIKHQEPNNVEVAGEIGSEDSI